MGRGIGKVDELILIRKRGDESLAWKTRPLDGVSVEVNVI